MKQISIREWHSKAAIDIRKLVAKEAGIHFEYLRRISRGAKVPVKTAVKIYKAAEKHLPEFPPPSMRSMVTREEARYAKEFTEMTK